MTAGGTSGDELRWLRTTTEEGLPVRAWGLDKRGSYPGEVGAAVGLGTEGRRGCYGAFAAAAKAARGRRVWLSKGKRKKMQRKGEGEWRGGCWSWT